MKKKKSNLKLFTKTWPTRHKENEEDNEDRPLTATLEKPKVLNIKFITEIDMSKIRKEFLCITNLCRFPLGITNKSKNLAVNNSVISVINRPLSLPSSDSGLKVTSRHPRRPETSQSSWEDEESIASQVQSAKSLKKSEVNRKKVTTAKTLTIKRQTMKRLDAKTLSDSNNNQKLAKIVRKKGSNIKSNAENSNVTSLSSTKLPEPCKTCGRHDQPERFHSHPVTPLKPIKKMDENVRIPVKSTVQKPTAIKYKSKQNDKPEPLRKSSLPAQNIVHSPVPGNENENLNGNRPKTGKKRKTLMCYVCGREFGTASLPLHEPRCLEKWERENANLPLNQRREIPKKPDCPMTAEKWNQLAWETCQAHLIPCENCGRTFLPDRLEIHHRSCKRPYEVLKSSENRNGLTRPAPLSPSAPANSVECSICKRMFGQKSIKIHEPQCLKKWQRQNELLPPGKRQPIPPSTLITSTVTTSDPQTHERQEKLTSPKRPAIVPCYLCGRLFSVSSINIHEPQCLKKWKLENEKLPLNKRRPEPQKPEIKLTPDGKIDFDAMNDLNWKTHLSQLVPCKVCGRTFNPDRVDVHERSCKG